MSLVFNGLYVHLMKR